MAKSFQVKKSLQIKPTTEVTTEAGEMRVAAEQGNRLVINDGVVEQPVGVSSASEVSYDNSVSGISATNVQDAIDSVSASTDAVAGSLIAHVTAPSGAHTAAAISFDATGTPLPSDAQGAIKDTYDISATAQAQASSALGQIAAHISDTTDAHAASAIGYDNTASGLSATDVQAAIDELGSTPSGANTSLSNLTSPTAVNQNLLFDVAAGETLIQAPVVNPSFSKGDLRVKGGDADAEGLYGPRPGGVLTLSAGEADPGSATAVTPAFIQLGQDDPDVTGSGLIGGRAVIRGGDAGTYSADPSSLPDMPGGDVEITSGGSTGSGSSSVIISATPAGTAGFSQNSPEEFLRADGINDRVILSKPLNMAATIAPAIPANGDIWFDGTKFKKQQQSVTTDLDTGGSGGAKNYLGTVNNINGNGDFETGTTAGWSLLTASLDSSNHPTGAPTLSAGTNTTFATSNASPLAGTQSLRTAWGNSPGFIWGAGQGFISDAFTLDSEDRGKPLAFKFSYGNLVGMDFADFSGNPVTSYLGIYIYDVTNSKWIVPAGSSSIVQKGGVGISTGSFQPDSNTTQLRIAVIARGPSSGTATSHEISFDSFFCGPQTAALGVPATDPIAYTPTFTGFGSPTGIDVKWSRVGPFVRILGSFISGSTSPSATASISLPSVVSREATGQIVGSWRRDTTANPAIKRGSLISPPNGGTLLFGAEENTSAASPAAGLNGDAMVLSGQRLYVDALIPVAGWSSNVNMSSDADTRVVAMAAGTLGTVASGGTSSGNPIIIGSVGYDSHGAYNPATGQYIAPVTGVYDLTGFFNATNTATVYVTVGGSPVRLLARLASGIGAGATSVYAIAGQVIAIAPDGNVGAWGGNNCLTISRKSGPATIAASEKVAMRATGQPSSVGAGAIIVFPSKARDSHSAYDVSTGRFTAPRSGDAVVSAFINSTNPFVFSVYVNGSVVAGLGATSPSGANAGAGAGSALISLNAGDVVDIRPNATTGTFSAGTTSTNFSIYMS